VQKPKPAKKVSKKKAPARKKKVVKKVIKKTTKKKSIDGRVKGANQERKIGKLFRTWATPIFDKVKDNSELWFIRAPGSGSWSKDHAPGEDLIVPQWFPFSLEIKAREGWDFEQVLQGKGPVIEWIKKAEETCKLPAMLIFTKNYSADWVLCSTKIINAETDIDYKQFNIINIPGLPDRYMLVELTTLLREWDTYSYIGEKAK